MEMFENRGIAVFHLLLTTILYYYLNFTEEETKVE